MVNTARPNQSFNTGSPEANGLTYRSLNIDELVRGFQRGIVEFRRLVAADAELQSRFKEYIVSD